MNEENANQAATDSAENGDKKAPPQLPELSEIDILSAKVAELEDNVALFKDQLLRKAAEFDNYKKRIDNDYSNFVKYANEELLEKLLPVVDDFERSLKALQESTVKAGDNNTKENQVMLKGIEMIYNKFQKILETHGVKPMDVLGKPFDHNYHDALLQVETKDHPHHTVIQEVEKGYMMYDRVLRHAKVIVSSAQAEDQSPKPDEKAQE
jgi:molecular chaperone GrpE